MKVSGLRTYLFLLIQISCSQPLVKTVAKDGNLIFQPIPYSDTDIQAPGRGAEQWHDRNEINIPDPAVNTRSIDKYYRFNWSEIETDREVYDWSAFDAQINDAIDHRQQFSFGIMTVNPLVRVNHPHAVNIDNKPAVYPRYVHDAMQSETVKDWLTPQTGTWIPNWNSSHYLMALQKLCAAINSHLLNGKYKDITYKDVINYIDIRGYGTYGEWHEADIVETMSDHPAGTQATAATLKQIIDLHVKEFPDFQLVMLLSVFDGNMLNNTKVPPEVGYHALTVKNNKGALGWRRDNWGSLDGYLERYLADNPTTINGFSFRNAIMERWKTAPVVGEPSNAGIKSGGCDYGALTAQIKKYHASSFGNGNISNAGEQCVAKNIREAAKYSGYRLLLEGGMIDSVIMTGSPLTIHLDWRNAGIAPVYQDWEPWYELRELKSDSLVWAGQSSFKIRLFLPSDTSIRHMDNFDLPKGIPPGHYSLSIIIKDPTDYRAPLPLAILGRRDNGSYALRSISIQ